MTQQTECFLEFERVFFRRDMAVILDDFSFKANEGEFLVIVGREISGKTTLLKLCAGLFNPGKGKIKIRNKPLSDSSYQEMQRFRQKTGFVFEGGVMVSNLSVRENMELPLRYHSSLNDKAINKEVEKYLEWLKITMYADERPAGLPEEIKLLASLARALVTEPDLLLMDDVFNSLSNVNVQNVIDVLEEIRNKKRMTCLSTTGLVNLMSAFLEEPLADSLMLIESGKITHHAGAKEVYETLKKGNW
ncbi:MAG: ATP-binding cassette domain-containing protein [Planctomycetes bacterium]|nr:ATP-binding cassette domain-containing protein [Planctomycetota bacterium]